MPPANTGVDALELRHTGATSDEGTQTDPNLCFGNYIAASVINTIGPTAATFNLGAQFTVMQTHEQNGEGTGVFTAHDASSVKWTPPGGTVGQPVPIANGETKLIEGTDKNKAMRIRRDNATSLTGSANVELVELSPNALSFDDVSDTERVGGDNEYRCWGVKNVSGSEIKSLTVRLRTLGTQRTSDTTVLPASGLGTIVTSGSFADWPDTGWVLIRTSGGSVREICYYWLRTDDTLTIAATGRGALGTTAAAGDTTDTVDAIPGLRIDAEAPSAQPSGNAQTIADESTEPTGRTWVVPVTDAEVETIGDLAAGYIYFIWAHREIIAGSTGQANIRNALRFEFEAA